MGEIFARNQTYQHLNYESFLKRKKKITMIIDFEFCDIQTIFCGDMHFL